MLSIGNTCTGNAALLDILLLKYLIVSCFHTLLYPVIVTFSVAIIRNNSVIIIM